MPKKLTTEEFIKKANNKHDNFYDYSLVDYVNSKTKIKIVCPIHEHFEQTPANHLRGQGCPKCDNAKKADLNKSNTEEFIKKANNKHDNFYDYSKVNYKRSNAKVTIICPIHGEFEQTPNNHLKGQGCSKCSGNYNYNTVEFIKRANKIHNNFYDYSKVDYINTHTKVKIICPVHGEFEQVPQSHLNGDNCSKCARTHSYNTDEFIEVANKIHNNKYDYSLVNYKSAKTKIIIACPEHGAFEQTPNNHLNGQGCPTCKSSKGEIRIENYLRGKNVEYIKEYTSKDLNRKRFDFFLVDKNLFIEYDGIQHFEPIKFSYSVSSEQAVENLIKQQQSDEEKNVWCKENNYELLRIKYTEFDNIEKILGDIL